MVQAAGEQAQTWRFGKTRWKKTMILMVSEMMITVSQGYCGHNFFKQKICISIFYLIYLTFALRRKILIKVLKSNRFVVNVHVSPAVLSNEWGSMTGTT